MDKTKIKKQIEEASFLNKKAKKEWFELVESANTDELKEIQAFFDKAKKAQDTYKLKLIYKSKLGKEYVKKMKEISSKYTKKALDKELKQKN